MSRIPCIAVPVRRSLGPALALTAAGPAAALTGIAPGAQDALQAAGVQAAHVVDLWRLMLVVCGAVFAAVIGAWAWALWRAHQGQAPDWGREPGHPPPPSRTMVRWIAGATGASGALLLALVGASAWTDRALAQLPLKDALHVRVTSYQWWWDLRYDDPVPARIFTTANELHVPVGRPVILTLYAGDVIHSLWVPRLAGKKDLIPGRTAQLQFRADKPGIYRGQCAEFCGAQHAHMALLVIAHEPAEYEAWASRQREPAPPPADERQARGRAVFMSGTCVMCHAVTGTAAGGRRGPDLTHIGSRLTLAAGTLDNRPGPLADWIRDPQRFKPAAQMPAHAYPDEDLQALLAWLGSLK